MGSIIVSSDYFSIVPTCLLFFLFCSMQRFSCFVSSLVMASCAVAHKSAPSAVAPTHPILNIHVTDSDDAATLNGLAEVAMNSNNVLGALENRAQATEDVLGNYMSIINAQIHELVNMGSAFAGPPLTGTFAQQLRGRSREQQFVAVPSDEVQTLKEQLDVVTRDARASDEDERPVDEPATDGFDASDAEAVAREKLMKAQTNFASVGNLLESDEQRAIDSKLASAMEAPSHIGNPAPAQFRDEIVSPCRVDAGACPQGWSSAGGACVASSDSVGPCASELTLSGMSEEQLRAIAKYCLLQLVCQ